MLPISDILIRSVCGFALIAPMLIVYYAYLKRIGKHQQPLRIVTSFLFCFYLFGVLTVTGIGYTPLRRFSPNLALIPFLDMITGPVDTALNVILFVPFGFFLPVLYKKAQDFRSVALIGFLFSLSIELAQMFDWGTTDINDLITNTAGACIGYLLVNLLRRKLKQSRGKAHPCLRNEYVELALMIAYAFAVMITVQPWVIHEFLNIG